MSVEPKVAVLEPKVAVLEPKVAVLEPKVAVLEPKESTLEESLRIFGFASLDEITVPLLKRTFKTKCVHAHPDRGGSSDQFDQLLTAYTILYKILRRSSRSVNDSEDAIALDPHAVLEAREKQFMDELHQVVGELMEQMDHLEAEERNEAFNEAFDRAATESAAINEFSAYTLLSQQKGYGEMMMTTYMEDSKEEEFATLSDFHAAFVSRARTDRPPSTALVLLQDQMANSSKAVGRELVVIPEDGQRISYGDGDLITVFDELPTLIQDVPIDMLHALEETEPSVMERFEKTLRDREIVYHSELDRDLIAIAEYESRQQDMERRRIEEVRNYFRGSASSTWALKE